MEYYVVLMRKHLHFPVLNQSRAFRRFYSVEEANQYIRTRVDKDKTITDAFLIPLKSNEFQKVCDSETFCKFGQ